MPGVFSGLNHPQFLIWRLQPKANRPGFDDKIPCKPDGKDGDATNPKNWLTYEQAAALTAPDGQFPEYGIGFCFTADDPYFFVDLDHCLVDGAWSELAVSVLNLFPGCYVEVSSGGDGLHVIGSSTTRVEHRNRNTGLGLELYWQDRFVALTGTQATGSAATDGTLGYSTYASLYFPPLPPVNPADWTCDPCADWLGPTGDAELIATMLRSKPSANAVFGGGASIKDLWKNNAAADLAYDGDHSRKDAALCQQLAFWTGKDCDRMDRIFRQSGLYRDKWDREDYAHRTILGAVGGCTGVYRSPTMEREAAAVPWHAEVLAESTGVPMGEPVTAGEIKLLTGPRIVGWNDRPTFFANHVFLTHTGQVFCPDGVSRQREVYRAMYGNREFTQPFGGKALTDPWKAYVLAPELERLEAYDTQYRPDMAERALLSDAGRVYVNEYRHSPGPRAEGDAGLFVNHVQTLLPNDRDAEILLSWMAALVQYPGKKFFWAPLIQGAQGNGKSLLARVLTYAIGDDHVEDVNPDELLASGGKFNAWIKNKRLAVIEELKVENQVKAEATLNRFISQHRIQYQPKGVDQHTIRTCVNFIITTNHMDAVPVRGDTRRYAPLFCAQQHKDDLVAAGMADGVYFKNLFAWLDKENGWGRVARFLDEYKIPDEFNPATEANRAPDTSATGRAFSESMNAGEVSLQDVLESNVPGTRGDWANKQIVQKLLGGELSLKRIGSILLSFGYITHPALGERGRASRSIPSEGHTRPVLYVKRGSTALLETTAGGATNQYEIAQGYAPDDNVTPIR